MKRALRLLGPTTVLLLITLILSAGAPGTASTGPGSTSPEGARETTYPAPVSNITQEPWKVQKGQDVKVTLELRDDAETPDRVSMIWCRVEPDYVCARPLHMTQENAGGWSATIPGSTGAREDVILEETRHIGYNISLRYSSGENHSDRVWAPTHNTWTPTTFPQDAVGTYYFIALQDNEAAPAVLLPSLLFLLSTLLIGLRRSKNTWKRADDQRQEDAP